MADVGGEDRQKRSAAVEPYKDLSRKKGKGDSTNREPKEMNGRFEKLKRRGMREKPF
ncbi:hypothetical protein HanRHA438_Chr13g0596581 [Helianthus annuus]|uniref:Uncharacterized protein n=1 Tax=Helianthus annuus TaxID=4232 RepID=A0A251SR55_HELAN|nr:hypothetical protein HanXRQr2_Chr13g0585931 [Helianthus annuus]KAJ0497531.1 hypothetical protein HanHA89_Chr13g0512371 [Helianthus annuus]KAJ0663546.1 hypothetical protein HanLR1_Chr13g0482371 [Helianthus annuus]KAJ0671040.1 hypothetical protein HanOQP8_Chr13g0481241 [Helianthus annuus]KAJ0849015.1 hypothetical protein HanPSC8_Chr13g0564091 [Helianthus annuus]